MARVTRLTKSEVERRRAAAERMRGLFADVAPDRSLVDELIADRRAEAAVESGGSAVRRDGKRLSASDFLTEIGMGEFAEEL